MLARERVEKDYMLLYENYGISTTIFSPLKGGILTGKYNEGIPEDSRLGKSKDSFTQVSTVPYPNAVSTANSDIEYEKEGWQRRLDG